MRPRLLLGCSSWLVALACGCGARTDLDLASGGGSGTGEPEVCNGVDDDSDGSIDEDLGELSCGLGVCLRTAPACVDGRPGECIPGPPNAEICNGIDDDCDTAVDEELGLVRRGGPYLIDADLTYLARTQLVATDEGLLAVYATSFNGQEPTPSVRVARMDADGILTNPPEILTTRNFTQGPRLAAMPDGWAMMYCGRFGFEDRAASGFLSPAGVFEEHGERSPAGKNCGAGDPGVGFTGARLLFGWIDNGAPDDVYLDRADASGASIAGDTIDANGDLSVMPRFASNGERAIMAYGVSPTVGESLLRVRVLDPTAESDLDVFDLTTPSPPRRWKDVEAAAGASGSFMLLGAHHSELGASFTMLDASGAVVRGPEPLPGTEAQNIYGPVLAANPNGGFVVIFNSFGPDADFGQVMTLDESGEITATWSTLDDPVEPALNFAAVAVRGGSIFVTYNSGLVADPDAPELRIVELGCPR